MTKVMRKFFSTPLLDYKLRLYYYSYKMIDKWAIPEKERYFPCRDCGNTKYCFNNELGDDAKPNKPVICIDCYVPENPTRGWMLSKAKKLGKLDFEHYKTLGTDAQQESYLKKILQIKTAVKDATEAEYSKDDR